MTSDLQFRRIRDVAFSGNAHMPVGWQAAVYEEESRVLRQILIPRGLDERLVLLVGGAGYIGGPVTDHLLCHGYKVRCIDALLYNNAPVVVPFLGHCNYEFMRGDFTDPAIMDAALAGVSDVVVLAGLVGDPITKKYPEESAWINHDGMLGMIRGLVGRSLNKVVFISTCSNYGLIPPEALADENYELAPLSLYAKAKVAMEQELLGMSGKMDFHPVILRFATAFGMAARMRFDLTVNEFTRALALGDELAVYDPDTWRPYCHVRDFAEVIKRCLEAPANKVSSQVFNAGGTANNFTKRMLVEAILAKLPGRKVAYQEFGTDPRNYRVDFSKIQNVLHFEPSHTVPMGIDEVLVAVEQGLFVDIGTPSGFHGNAVIRYAR